MSIKGSNWISIGLKLIMTLSLLTSMCFADMLSEYRQAYISEDIKQMESLLAEPLQSQRIRQQFQQFNVIALNFSTVSIHKTGIICHANLTYIPNNVSQIVNNQIDVEQRYDFRLNSAGKIVSLYVGGSDMLKPIASPREIMIDVQDEARHFVPLIMFAYVVLSRGWLTRGLR